MKNVLRIKLKASSLLLSIVIALILTLLCSSFLLISYYNKLSQLSLLQSIKAETNIESQINVVLSQNDDGTVIDDSLSLDNLEGEQNSIIRNRWGLFEIATVQSKIKRINVFRTFMYGAYPPDYMEGCLYLADHQRPLVIGEHAQLTGKIIAPESGIKKNGNTLVFTAPNANDENRFSHKMPMLKKGTIDYLYSLTNGVDQFDKRVTSIASQVIKNKFTEKTLIIKGQGVLTIDSSTVSGNVLIISDSVIHITKNNELKDIILVAPYIEIDNYFSGCIQAFATKKLEVGENCRLNYPTGLVLLNYGKDINPKQLIINQETLVNGTVLVLSPEDSFNKPVFENRKNSRIKGLLYIQGYSFLEGQIDGSIATDYIINRSNGATYENYLDNIIINRDSLDKAFVGALVFSGNHQNGIVKWLD